MKLSAAMRIGSMTSKQIKGKWSDGGNGRCALGSISNALNFNDFYKKYGYSRKTYDTFPQLISSTIHPVNNTKGGGLSGVISSLNDQYSWTREQIADWIEDLENQGLITYTEEQLNAAQEHSELSKCDSNIGCNKQTLAPELVR